MVALKKKKKIVKTKKASKVEEPVVNKKKKKKVKKVEPGIQLVEEIRTLKPKSKKGNTITRDKLSEKKVRRVPVVEALLKFRSKPKMFSKKMGELLTKQTTHPVEVTFMRNIEKYEDIEQDQRRMPWVRVYETDTGAGEAPYLTIIHISHSFLAKEILCRRGLVGLLDKLQKGK